MRVMVIVKADRKSEAENEPTAGDEQLLREMGKYNEELVEAGVMLAGEGLRPSRFGRRVRFAGAGRTTVVDGPFAETKELVAGFWLWKVGSMDEAVAWLKKAPFREGELEIRQVYETEDFAAADPTGALREQENRLRAEIGGRQ